MASLYTLTQKMVRLITIGDGNVMFPPQIRRQVDIKLHNEMSMPLRHSYGRVARRWQETSSRQGHREWAKARAH